MKQTLTLLFLLLTLFATAQNFGKHYPYWEEASGDAVIAYDDGYAILGFASKVSKDNSLFIIRTDLNGDTLWTKEMDVVGQYLNGYTQDSDGNIYLAPHGTESVDLIKLSADFEVLWMRGYDPKIEIKQLIVSKDNNLLFNGKNALNEPRLYKANKEGNILWQSVALPHSNPQTWLAYTPAILEMGDNTVILVSVLSTMIEPHACEIYYFSQNGDTISSTNFDWVLSDVYIDGNVLIGLAHYEPNLANWEGNLLVRFQPDGTILSSRSLNFDPQTVSLYKFFQNSNGELIAAGAAYSEYGQDNHVILHGMSASGDSLWSSLSMPSFEIFPYDITLCSDGGYVVNGYSKDLSSKNTPFLLKTNARGTLSIDKPMVSLAISVFPNPAREEVAFEIMNINSGIITITDIFGRTIGEVVITGEKTIWDSRAVAPGTYFYQFDDGKQLSSGKFLIVK
jgi:hypothetical protein